MDKIIEALSKVLQDQNQLKEVSEAVEAYLKEAKAELQKEYDSKLEAAYTELSGELKEAEKVAEQGYHEAYGIIADLRNRLETQRAEFEAALEEGYEEAFQMLKTEQGKNANIESELYEEYDKKLAEMKEYFIDKIDEFLQLKGKEIYEQARKEMSNDPALAEHKVTLNKIVETVADYITDEEYALATTSKLEEAQKAIEELGGKVRLLEARNVRISAENTKLTEAVREREQVIKEHAEHAAKDEKKEQQEKAQNVTGRGSKVTEDQTKVIKEHQDEPKAGSDADNKQEKPLVVEGLDWNAVRTLAGLKPAETK